MKTKEKQLTLIGLKERPLLAKWVPPKHWPITWSDVEEGPLKPGVTLRAFVMTNDCREHYCFVDGNDISYPTIFFRTPLNKNRTRPI